MLCGPCRRANGVALDPLPEMHQDGTAALVRVGRERFLARLLERGRPGPAGHTREVAEYLSELSYGDGPWGD